MTSSRVRDRLERDGWQLAELEGLSPRVRSFLFGYVGTHAEILQAARIAAAREIEVTMRSLMRSVGVELEGDPNRALEDPVVGPKLRELADEWQELRRQQWEEAR